MAYRYLIMYKTDCIRLKEFICFWKSPLKTFPFQQCTLHTNGSTDTFLDTMHQHTATQLPFSLHGFGEAKNPELAACIHQVVGLTMQVMKHCREELDLFYFLVYILQLCENWLSSIINSTLGWQSKAFKAKGKVKERSNVSAGWTDNNYLTSYLIDLIDKLSETLQYQPASVNEV